MSGKHSSSRSSDHRDHPNQQGSKQKSHLPRHPEAERHDTYVRGGKVSGAFQCEDCGVVQHGGRWFWGVPPLGEVRVGRCPACERIRDRYPAGTLRLPAAFIGDREALLNLLHNAEAAEREEHPLERLMEVVDGPGGGLVVTTTGVHLARRLANALERRFHRQARFHYPEGQHLLLVEWDADPADGPAA